MLRLILPGNHAVLIDDASQLMVAGFAWRVLRSNSDLLYAHAWHGKLHLYMHRLIAGAGPNEEVDHWNGNGLDNQGHNLRIASRGQQQANRGRQRNNRSSQYKGVTRDQSRKGTPWMAFITENRKSKYLGRFASEEDAARAYDQAAAETWGQFARLNFPVDNGLICGVHKLGIPESPCTCPPPALSPLVKAIEHSNALW
jgi:AP2 domain